ncbi:hypothetical protein [Luteibacter yeojuensis]
MDTDVPHVLSRAFVLLRVASLGGQLYASQSAGRATAEWVTNWLITLGLYDHIEDIQDDYAAAFDASLGLHEPVPAHSGFQSG